MRSSDNENLVERNCPRVDKFYYGDWDEKRYLQACNERFNIENDVLYHFNNFKTDIFAINNISKAKNRLY